MAPETHSPLKPGWIGVIASYLGFAAVLMRTFGIEEIGSRLPGFIALQVVYIVLFSLVLWQYQLPKWLAGVYLLVQAGLVLRLLWMWPDFDFVALLFVLLSYQASLLFTGRSRWLWIVFLILCMTISLIYYHGLWQGLALSLTNIVACVVLPALLITNHEIELARQQSQALLVELQAGHLKLQEYASQVEELTAMQERNRLARELHDTVSQMIFSISLTTRSAQLLLDKDPARLLEQLHALQETTSAALKQLRSLITQLRPPQET
jgi:signal transduction histidine kinase